ncbi:MAG: septal ring lytic transglycosylase RlpA family protein [Candidatus Riflemargulisbacteria bacterium]
MKNKLYIINIFTLSFLFILLTDTASSSTTTNNKLEVISSSKQNKYLIDCNYLNISPNIEMFTTTDYYWDEKYGSQNGLASTYGKELHGNMTNSGEIFDMNAYTAAHKKLPIGTIIKVTDMEERHKNYGNVVYCRINDRGPFVRKRIIDLSTASAKKLGRFGVFKIKLEILSPNTLVLEKILKRVNEH